MSSATPCNYCDMLQITAYARRHGKAVTVRPHASTNPLNPELGFPSQS